MKRDVFLEKMEQATSFINVPKMFKLIRRSIHLGNKHHTFGSGSVNLVIAIEELSELQKEISKWLRGDGDKVALTEEIADVSIMMEYIRLIADINQQDINKAINVKLDRLEERDKDLED